MKTDLSIKTIKYEGDHSSLHDYALKTPDAAEFLGLSPKTLHNWRVMGVGPSFQKGPGRRGSIRYPISSLKDWRDRHLQSSTSQNGGSKA